MLSYSSATRHILVLTWCGNDTYFNASYWHHELSIFDNEQNEYLYSGQICRGCLVHKIMTPDMQNANIRLTKTKNWESLK